MKKQNFKIIKKIGYNPALGLNINFNQSGYYLADNGNYYYHSGSSNSSYGNLGNNLNEIKKHYRIILI